MRFVAAAFVVGVSLTGPQLAVATAEGPDSDSGTAADSAAGNRTGATARSGRPAAGVTRPERRGQAPARTAAAQRARVAGTVAWPPVSALRTPQLPSGVNIAAAQPVSGAALDPEPTVTSAAGAVGRFAVAARDRAVALSVGNGGCSACWGMEAPSITQAVGTVVNHLFNSAFTVLSSFPGSPISDLVAGALVLIRRSLFFVPEGVTASMVGNSLTVSVNTGSVAYFRQNGSAVQVSGDPWFFGAQSFYDTVPIDVLVSNAGNAGCAGVVLTSGTVNGNLVTSQIDDLRFGAGAAFSNQVTATVTGGVLTLRDAVRGLGGVEFNGPVILANDVDVDAGLEDATFNGTVDAARAGKQGLTVTALGATSFAAAVGGQSALASLVTQGFAPLNVVQSADTKTIPLHYVPEFNTTGPAPVKYGIDVAIGDNPSQLYEFDTGGVALFAGYNPAFWSNVPLTSTPISETYSSSIYYNGVIADTRITLGSGSQTVSTAQPIQIAAILNGGNANSGTTFDFTNPAAPPVEDRFFGDFGASFTTLPVPGDSTPLANPLFQLPGNLSSGFLVQLGPIGIQPQLTVGITDALRAQFPYAVPVTPQPGGGTYPVSGYDVLSWFGFAPSYTAMLGGDEQQIGVDPTLPSLIDSGAPSTGIRIKGQGGNPFDEGGQLQPGATFTAVFPTTQGRSPLTWSFQAGDIGSVNLVNYEQGQPGSTTQNVNTGLNLYNAFDVMFDVAEGVIWLRPTGGQATVSLLSVTTTGAQTYRQNAQLTGTYTTTGGDFSVAGVTTLFGSTVVNAGNVRFSGTVDSISGAQTLAVNSSGNTTFAREVGSQLALGSLTTDAGGTTSTASVQTTGNQVYGDPVSLNGLYAAGGSFSAQGATTLTGPVSVSGGDITFNGRIDSTPGAGYTLTLLPGDGKTASLNGDVGVSNPLGGLTVQATSGGSATVLAPEYVALSGDLGFSADVGLYIGDGVTARFTGGGVIRQFHDSGVVIEESTDSVIDGLAISTNGRDGIQINGATNPQVTNNVILGNGEAGIDLVNTDGATVSSNTVLNNVGPGVIVDTGIGNAILSNSIAANGGTGGLGISLTNGGNRNQPTPQVNSVTLNPTLPTMTVDATIVSRPDYSGTFTVQVFYSPAGSTTAVQGQQLLYQQASLAAGTVQLSFQYPVALSGGSITVTATPDTGPQDTSEFSNAVAISA